MWTEQIERGDEHATPSVDEPKLVPVVFADDASEADRYCGVLAYMGVTAIVGEPGDAGTLPHREQLPVLVEAGIDERASEILASYDAGSPRGWDDAADDPVDDDDVLLDDDKDDLDDDDEFDDEDDEDDEDDDVDDDDEDDDY
ncbi:MAG: hypothetical protein ACE5E6_03575 [Phycisphaerae bacterium]